MLENFVSPSTLNMEKICSISLSQFILKFGKYPEKFMDNTIVIHEFFWKYYKSSIRCVSFTPPLLPFKKQWIDMILFV